MKKAYRCILPLMTSLLLCGCTAQGNTASSSGENENSVSETEKTEAVTEAPTYDIGTDIAVISIETKNQAEGVIDFVTKPVAEHVSKSIASWTPNYKMPPAPYYEECRVTVKDKENNVTLDRVDAMVKVRGNWTTTYDKKPLRIKFVERQNILGLNEGAQTKNWVLLAQYKDGSMLRDKAALEIARELYAEDGLYASDAEFVEVEINGEYWGVYLLAEMQQINADRVSITEAPKDYTGTDIGYFMEFDGYYTNESELQSFHVDYADNAPLTPFDGKGGNEKTITCLSEGRKDEKSDVGITIKSDIYSQEQHDFIESYVNNVYRIMYSAAYEDKAYTFNEDYSGIAESNDLTPQEAVEQVVNVESLADAYILNEIACDADIYWSSFFMDVDFGEGGDKKLTFEAPWDFDSAFGNKSRCTDGTGFYAANIVPDVNDVYETVNPWLAVLMYEEWFTDIIRENWTQAYDSGVFERVIDMINEDTTQYADAFTRNYSKWNNLVNNSAFRGELSRYTARCKTHAEASQYLCEWLGSRIEFLNEYWHS